MSGPLNSPRSHKRKPVLDPAEAANKRILADRQQRLDDKAAVDTFATDLGLDLKDPPSLADNPADFLADEWDRKTFGDAIPTYTRVVYGPDPLLISCPHMKAAIEKIGLESYANATMEAILLKEDKAVADPIMQTGLRAAIARFGVSAVALAFRDRIMKIPERNVEVEADRSDAMIFAQPMEEAVMRYGTPGMAPKFLSERCIGVLGMRGYVVVKDEKGDPVKVGTLIMGEIPLRMAEARRRHYADLSDQDVKDAAEVFEDTAARAIRDGGRGGISVLRQGESVSSNAAGDFEDAELTASYLGQNRETGFRVERQK
jgi:hypothetical protein